MGALEAPNLMSSSSKSFACAALVTPVEASLQLGVGIHMGVPVALPGTSMQTPTPSCRLASHWDDKCSTGKALGRAVYYV